MSGSPLAGYGTPCHPAQLQFQADSGKVVSVRALWLEDGRVLGPLDDADNARLQAEIADCGDLTVTVHLDEAANVMGEVDLAPDRGFYVPDNQALLQWLAQQPSD